MIAAQGRAYDYLTALRDSFALVLAVTQTGTIDIVSATDTDYAAWAEANPELAMEAAWVFGAGAGLGDPVLNEYFFMQGPEDPAEATQNLLGMLIHVCETTIDIMTGNY